MQRELLVAVAEATKAEITGVFYRHSHPERPFQGSASGGRWGPEGTYSVLYLGRPPETIIVEAYRHLVDDDEDLTGEMVGPRLFSTVEVNVTNILDLRDTTAQKLVGLDHAALYSDIDEHAPCRRIGQAAHQLGLHGVIAPAATDMGETLALFDEQLPASELPHVVETTIWAHLPPDPRRLRAVDDGAETA